MPLTGGGEKTNTIPFLDARQPAAQIGRDDIARSSPLACALEIVKDDENRARRSGWRVRLMAERPARSMDALMPGVSIGDLG